MAADGVEPEPRRAPVVPLDEERDAGQRVLEDRLAVAEMALVLHAELGKGTAADDGDA